MSVDPFEQLGEVVAGEGPLERACDLSVMLAKPKDSFRDRFEGREVVRGQRFTLQDREVDLDLVQPRRVYGEMDQPCVRPTVGHPLDRSLPGVRGAVVNDPV